MYEYRTINISLEPKDPEHPLNNPTITSTANRYAAEGWRTVSVMPSQGPGYADSILLERWNK